MNLKILYCKRVQIVKLSKRYNCEQEKIYWNKLLHLNIKISLPLFKIKIKSETQKVNKKYFCGSDFLFLLSMHRENSSKTQRKLDTRKFFYAVIRMIDQPY